MPANSMYMYKHKRIHVYAHTCNQISVQAPLAVWAVEPTDSSTRTRGFAELLSLPRLAQGQEARGVPGNNVYIYKHKRIHVHTHTRVISMQAPLAGSLLRHHTQRSCWMKSSARLRCQGKEGIIRTPREIHNTSAHTLNPPLPRALLPVRGLCGGMWVVDPYLASTRCW